MIGLDWLKYQLKSVYVGLGWLLLVWIGQYWYGVVIIGLDQLVSV